MSHLKYILATVAIIAAVIFVSIIIYRSSETPFVQDYVESRYIAYKGKVNVVGEYVMTRCVYANDVCDTSWEISFIVNNDTANKIPRVEGDDRMAWFSFQNKESDVINKLGIDTSVIDSNICKISGHAEIVIKDYLEFTAPSMGSDATNLEDVIDLDKPVFVKCD